MKDRRLNLINEVKRCGDDRKHVDKWVKMGTDIKENSNYDSKGGSEEYNSVEAKLPMTKNDLFTIETNF